MQYRAAQQIKGIKKVGAMTMSAELGELQHYGRNQMVGASGIFPKCFESGRSVRRKPRMAKGGGGRLRRVLYMGATRSCAARDRCEISPSDTERGAYRTWR